MSFLIVFTLILFLISIPYRREKVRNPQGKKEEFHCDSKTAYKLAFEALKHEHPDRATEFDAILKLGRNDYRYAVLTIEQALRDEEAEKAKKVSEPVMNCFKLLKV